MKPGIMQGERSSSPGLNGKLIDAPGNTRTPPPPCFATHAIVRTGEVCREHAGPLQKTILGIRDIPGCIEKKSGKGVLFRLPV